MNKKLLSIIVPVYNVAPYINRCLESLLQQTYDNLEIILIDDGSTDSSGSLCDLWAQKTNKIKVVHQTNAGVSAARNVGLSIAEGEYIGFVDPDDWCEPNMYEQLICIMETDCSDAVFCGYWEDYEQNSIPSIEHSPKRVGIVNGEEAFYQCMIGVGHAYFTSVWNKCFRHQAIIDFGIPFPVGCRIAEDELWLAHLIPKLSRISLTNQMLYHWWQRPESACHKQVVDERWYKALETKVGAADILAQNPAYKNLAYGKVYSDLAHCIWIGYCAGSKKDEVYFRNALMPYREYFWKAQEYSIQKKLKFFILDWMCRLRIHKKYVHKLNEKTTKQILHTIQRQ